MKCKNFKVFKQLLIKGVSPMCMNADGMTAVHYAVEMGRLEYLTYLFEGDSQATESSKGTQHDTKLQRDSYNNEYFALKVSTVNTSFSNE